ncbi:MAG: type VI secretion system baseplate subunit TssK [Advenella sp.]|nr:type VI secretion system baseplate subunit TssK [Advenella sp.]
MNIKNKVVWSEGMFLRPHHFQQFEHYLASNAQIRQESAEGYFWGFRELEIDTDALLLGKIIVTHARGILPDGTAFSFHGAAGPAALEVPAGTFGQRVYLALPRYRAESEDVVFDDADDSLARYAVIEEEVFDVCDVSMGTALIQTGRLRLRLILESDFGDEWIGMPIGIIGEKNDDRKVMLDKTYIPPVLSYAASPVLNQYIKEIAGLLEARSELLANRLQQPGRSGVAEVSEFMILETINRYRGAFWHMMTLAHLHPERVFHDFLMLASDLATFTRPDKRMKSFPAYIHDGLHASFLPLLEILRAALTSILDEQAIRIPLHDKGAGLRVGQVPDLQLLHSAEFILAVYADMPAETVRMHFPAQAKLGPVERIRDLVHLQLPGVSLRLMSNVPRQLPYSAGHIYFSLEKTGEMWKQLERTGALALHLAGEFPGLALEFWAIRQERG